VFCTTSRLQCIIPLLDSPNTARNHDTPGMASSGDSLLPHPYETSLPRTSQLILGEVLSGLVGRETTPDPDRRLTHSIAAWHSGDSILRCTILTPELVTCTASLPKSFTSECYKYVGRVSESLNDAKECTISSYAHTCRVMGRMTPYLLKEIGQEEDKGVHLTHANATSSRILFSLTTTDSSSLYSLTYESLRILMCAKGSDVAMVYQAFSSKFKVTIGTNETNDLANKNTCIMISHNGEMKIQGTPGSMRGLCAAFRTTILDLSYSRMWPAFLINLELSESIKF
jgi:hypothetical protein